MQILSFLLGISAVLILMGVVVVFNMYRKIKELQVKLTGTVEVQNEIFRIIDELRRDETQGKNEIYNTISVQYKEFERMVDSRLDKLENKLKTKSSKQVIND
jgi:hypothetical protein